MKEIGMKETGILVSCSDYHIFMKLKMTRKQAMEHYLSVIKECLEEGISPLPHPEPPSVPSVLYLPTGSTAADPPAFLIPWQIIPFLQRLLSYIYAGNIRWCLLFAAFLSTCKMKGKLETSNLLFVKSFENFTCQLNSVIKIGIS